MKKLTTILSTITTMAILYSANSMAEDIDIYRAVGNKDAQNNVLFMIDNSGSMRTLSNSTTRFDHVKIGLGNVLKNLHEDVNVGVGVYNGNGGSIIAPIRKIGDISYREANVGITLSEDDGIETDTNKIFNDTSTLTFGTHAVTSPSQVNNYVNSKVVPLAAAATATGTVSISKKVTSIYDDAIQCTNGSNYYYADHIGIYGGWEDYCRRNNDFIASTIFRDLNLPKNARILKAYVKYTYYGSSYNNYSNVDIRVENSVNPRTYSWYASREVVSRDMNSNSINWYQSGGGSYETVVTPDISELVQMMVNNNYWDQYNNGINIFLYPKGPKSDKIGYYSYDGSQSRAAKIYIDYTMEDPIPDSSHNLVGLNFKNIDIASYSVLERGELQVVSGETVNGGGDITIKIVDPRDAGEITDDKLLSTRRIVAEKTFISSNWIAGKTYSFDLKDVLTTAFHNDNWCGSNNLTIILESNKLSSIKAIDSSDTGESPSKILIKQTDTAENSCFIDTLVYGINLDLNDADNSSSIRDNYRLGNGVKAGLRFENIRISDKDEIIDASLEMAGYANSSKNYGLTIYGDVSNNNNPLNFDRTVSSLRVENRNNLTSGLNVNLTPFSSNQKVEIKNISSIIKNITGRSNWVEGNSIVLILNDNTSNSGYATITAYERNIPHQRTKLLIKIRKIGKDIPPTVRENVIDLIYGLDTAGGTPTLGSTVEAYQYFKGGRVIGGVYRDEKTINVSHPETWNGGVLETPVGCSKDDYNSSACAGEKITGNPIYQSPVSSGFCETNSIIMLTDGEPTDQSREYLKNGVKVFDQVKSITGQNCSNNWDCINKLTKYMAENDIRPDLNGEQNIYTNVVGFGELASKTELEQYAASGKGAFYTVQDSSTLADTMTIVLNNILDIEATISMPGVSVDQSNKLQFKNDLYYSVFKPSNLKSWDGNLKRYKIVNNKTTGESKFEIVDANNNNAIDYETGFFKEGSQSYWSDVIDGGDSKLGGSASKLSKNRNLYTYTVDGISNVNLSGANYKINRDNPLLKKSMFNIGASISDSEFYRFLDWSRGLDVKDENQNGVTDEARKTMADPLHGKPIVIPYNQTDATVFISTNEGILHGFDANTGEELFGFVPKQLLPNLYNRYKNSIGTHQYGLDSTWVAYRNDEDKDGIMGNNEKDFTYIYSGMRRGGSSMFGLDVTNINKEKLPSGRTPKFLWEINPEKSSEFSNMGQTWSTPVLAKVKINDQDKIVVVFGGGYDLKNDNEKVLDMTKDKGNQLYMVDAKTGQLLWWASNKLSNANLKIEDMNYSVVSKPTLLDLDNDGYLDYIYINDTAGQIIKFKFNKENRGASSLAIGKVFAKLGKTDSSYIKTIENDRKFYEKVAIVPVVDNSGKAVYVVSGSGHRASPLTKTTKDGMFVMKDNEILAGSFTQSSPILISDLLDVTKTKDEVKIKSDLQTKKGFAIWLNEGYSPNSEFFRGEKVLGDLVIFNGSLLFSTYVPDESNRSCEYIGVGGSRTYSVDILTGSPSNPPENTEGKTVNEQRFKDEILTGISSGSKIIYTEDGVVSVTNTSVETMSDINGLGFFKNRWLRKTNETEDQIPEHIKKYRDEVSNNNNNN